MDEKVGRTQPSEGPSLRIVLVAASILVFGAVMLAGAVQLEINATINATQGAWNSYYAGELNVSAIQNGSQWLINVMGGNPL